MLSLLFLFFLSSNINCDPDFDRVLLSYESFARIWVYGYYNERNIGLFRRCCYLSEGFRCLPCQYRVVVRFRQNDPNTFAIGEFYYNIGTFSRAAEMLFETFYFEKLYSYDLVDNFDVNYFVVNGPSTRPIEIMEKMFYIYYGTYEFDGTFGINNNIRSWTVLSLSKLGSSRISLMNVVLQSVYFDKYRLTNGECCFDSVDEPESYINCPYACPFYVSIYSGSVDLATTRIVAGRNRSRYYQYNLTMGYYANYLARTAGKLQIRIMSSDKRDEIDTLELRNLALFRFRTYYFNNVIGITGNVVANISINLYCTGFGGTFCASLCSDVKNVDSCGNAEGVAKCLNGANDNRKCENFTLSCENNPCLNNGTCKILNEQLKCYCEPGFEGKYCEVISCRQDCNRRGICVAPNKCVCGHPFFGSDCEIEQCNLTYSNICKNGGLCYFQGLEPKCDCKNTNYEGPFCNIPLCASTCINGICLDNNSTKLNKCICYDGYEGPTCELKSSKLYKSNNYLVLPTLITLAILSCIIGLLISLKLFGIICVTKRQTNMMSDENN